jgi:FkbM family methyltransferase
MGQDNKIIVGLKKIYKKIIFSKKLNGFLKKIIDKTISFLAKKKGLSFPKKFTWDWKLDMFLENYEKNTVLYFKKNIKSGMIIVDIGAHIGYYTLLFSKLVGPNGKVYAFEPDPDNFDILQKNTSDLKNVEIFKIALSDIEGKISFYKIYESTGCHSIVLPEAKAEKIIVDSITLDSFLDYKKISDLDFIKIDIEGGEPFALKGMKKTIANSSKIKIISEFNPEAIHQSNKDPIEFLNDIRKNNLETYTIGAKGDIKIFEDIKQISFYKAKEKYTNILCKKIK